MHVLVTCHYAHCAYQDPLSYGGWRLTVLLCFVYYMCVPGLILLKVNHVKLRLLYESIFQGVSTVVDSFASSLITYHLSLRLCMVISVYTQ